MYSSYYLSSTSSPGRPGLPLLISIVSSLCRSYWDTGWGPPDHCPRLATSTTDWQWGPHPLTSDQNPTAVPTHCIHWGKQGLHPTKLGYAPTPSNLVIRVEKYINLADQPPEANYAVWFEKQNTPRVKTRKKVLYSARTYMLLMTAHT